MMPSRNKTALILTICILFSLYPSVRVFAEYHSDTMERTGHDRDNHDHDIELVLFGDIDYKATHTSDSETIQALEDAVYLCVDQYNGNGQCEFDHLKKREIPNFPASLSDINFFSNYTHRLYTHRGWNLAAVDDISHFKIRKELLLNTVRHELFTNKDTPLNWFPWLSNQIYGTKGSEKQLESFCILLYYTHILGDHMEAQKFTSLAYTAPLVRPNDRDNPGVLPEIITCLKTVFSEQKSTFTYMALMQELEEIQSRSERLINSTGGINTQDKFIDYHKCAADTLKVLGRYVPQLLRNETFFKSAFYK